MILWWFVMSGFVIETADVAKFWGGTGWLRTIERAG